MNANNAGQIAEEVFTQLALVFDQAVDGEEFKCFQSYRETIFDEASVKFTLAYWAGMVLALRFCSTESASQRREEKKF